MEKFIKLDGKENGIIVKYTINGKKCTVGKINKRVMFKSVNIAKEYMRMVHKDVDISNMEMYLLLSTDNGYHNLCSKIDPINISMGSISSSKYFSCNINDIKYNFYEDKTNIIDNCGYLQINSDIIDNKDIRKQLRYKLISLCELFVPMYFSQFDNKDNQLCKIDKDGSFKYKLEDRYSVNVLTTYILYQLNKIRKIDNKRVLPYKKNMPWDKTLYIYSTKLIGLPKFLNAEQHESYMKFIDSMLYFLDKNIRYYLSDNNIDISEEYNDIKIVKYIPIDSNLAFE